MIGRGNTAILCAAAGIACAGATALVAQTAGAAWALAGCSLSAAAATIVRFAVRARRTDAVIARQAHDLRAAGDAIARLRDRDVRPATAEVARPVDERVRASMTVLLAATRALAEPASGLTGRAAELAESAARNAAAAATLLQVDEPRSPAPSKELVDVALLLREAVGADAGDVELAIEDPVAGIADAHRLRGALRQLVVAYRDGTLQIRAHATAGRAFIEMRGAAPAADEPVAKARALLSDSGATITLDNATGAALVSMPALPALDLRSRTRWSPDHADALYPSVSS